MSKQDEQKDQLLDHRKMRSHFKEMEENDELPDYNKFTSIFNRVVNRVLTRHGKRNVIQEDGTQDD